MKFKCYLPPLFGEFKLQLKKETVTIKTFNEGGKHLTLSYCPEKHWLRLYIFGFVFEFGGLYKA